MQYDIENGAPPKSDSLGDRSSFRKEPFSEGKQ